MFSYEALVFFYMNTSVGASEATVIMNQNTRLICTYRKSEERKRRQNEKAVTRSAINTSRFYNQNQIRKNKAGSPHLG